MTKEKEQEIAEFEQKMHEVAYRKYCSEMVENYIALFRERWAERHNKKMPLELRDRRYIKEVVRNIRAYKNGGDFANTPARYDLSGRYIPRAQWE